MVSEEDEINERQKMRALTETEIVEAVRRGRREGQTEMVCRYAERIFAMVVRQVPNVMDAQELTKIPFYGLSATSTDTSRRKLRSPHGSAALPTA